jgi:murein DD-endopeptidase MepM/ murein hydrolase activator NlpD
MNRALPAAFALALAACAGTPHAQTPARSDGGSGTPLQLDVPATVAQGALVVGNTDPDAVVTVDGQQVRVSPRGEFAFGIGRDASGEIVVAATRPGASKAERRIRVTPRDWPVERIDGLPPATVSPPPAIQARIRREHALVANARLRDDARTDFLQPFVWPVEGRVSGRFGNQRVYMLPDGSGTPKSPHSGMDIAAKAGTPVRAPAAGVITLAEPAFYLEGGTLILDHGHGVSSNFLHLSRIDVRVGERIAQGQVLGAVGASGRATGPHLHWGMNWFKVRIDPLLVLERAHADNATVRVPASDPQATPAKTRMSPKIGRPGFPVPGSSVSLPATAAAGSTVEGRAPPGSRVEYLGEQLTVPASGLFQVAIPAHTVEPVMVRIERPGMTPLRLRIGIAGD